MESKQILDEIRNPWISLFFGKGKREKREIDKSKEPRILMKFENHGIEESNQILVEIRNPCFLSRRIPIFSEGMRIHGFLSFWKRKKGKGKREKNRIPNSQSHPKKESKYFMKRD
jgi:hypothetical protein